MVSSLFKSEEIDAHIQPDKMVKITAKKLQHYIHLSTYKSPDADDILFKFI